MVIIIDLCSKNFLSISPVFSLSWYLWMHLPHYSGDKSAFVESQFITVIIMLCNAMFLTNIIVFCYRPENSYCVLWSFTWTFEGLQKLRKLLCWCSINMNSQFNNSSHSVPPPASDMMMIHLPTCTAYETVLWMNQTTQPTKHVYILN